MIQLMRMLSPWGPSHIHVQNYLPGRDICYTVGEDQKVSFSETTTVEVCRTAVLNDVMMTAYSAGSGAHTWERIMVLRSSLVPRPRTRTREKGFWGQYDSQLDPMTLMSGMWDGQSEFS